MKCERCGAEMMRMEEKDFLTGKKDTYYQCSMCGSHTEPEDEKDKRGLEEVEG